MPRMLCMWMPSVLLELALRDAWSSVFIPAHWALCSEFAQQLEGPGDDWFPSVYEERDAICPPLHIRPATVTFDDIAQQLRKWAPAIAASAPGAPLALDEMLHALDIAASSVTGDYRPRNAHSKDSSWGDCALPTRLCSESCVYVSCAQSRAYQAGC